MEAFPSWGSTLAAPLALLPDALQELDRASQEDGTPRPREHPGPRRVGWGLLPALRPLSKRPVLTPQRGEHTLQLAILFYWLMWASGQEELGWNQYSFYYVIVSK